MSHIRLKVQVNEKQSGNSSYRKTPVVPLKFIYIFDPSSTTTINDLRCSLEQYIIRQFAKKNIRIVQLLTDDGYFLPENGVCQQVLQDNERIVCVDMDTFVEENSSTLICENSFCEIKKHDVSDDREKYIEVGLDKTGKLFIRMNGAWKMYGLYLFNVFQLIRIAAEQSPNTLIGRLSDQDWFIEAKWEYHSTSKNILYLICSLKLASGEQISTDKITLSLDETQMTITKTAIEHLSDGTIDANALTKEQVERLKELTANIPPPKRSGPEFDLNEHTNKTITKHECQGDSIIRMACGSTNTVQTSQDVFASSDGTFRQHFFLTHINFIKTPSENENETNKSISVTEIKLLYQSEDESWHECEGIAIAPITHRNEEPYWLADSVIDMESEKFVSYAIKGSIKIKGKPGNDNFRRRRAHRSLPQPLKLQIQIKDNFNKQSSLIVEQLNEPLNIITAELFTKKNESSLKELLAYVYADDLESEERIYLAMYLDEKSHLVIKSSHGYSIRLEQKSIRTMSFNAKKNQTTEEVFDSMAYNSDDQQNKATALFDPQTFLFYAVRLQVKTQASTSEEIVLLPLDKIE